MTGIPNIKHYTLEISVSDNQSKLIIEEGQHCCLAQIQQFIINNRFKSIFDQVEENWNQD